ncbi:MAG: pyruvate kinase [Candidatus Diapherotrites archaeon]|nr:pyruvate kinase [Candidatus Diapherotrites archaeon]
MPKRVKIIATIGPSSANEETMRKMYEAGMDAMRINMSHGDYDEHQPKINMWRDIAPEKPIILDLTGPSIRTRIAEPITVKEGQKLEIGKDFDVSRPIQDAVVPGDTILIDDGTVTLEVEEVRGNKIDVVVTVGGTIKNNKSVNVPGAEIHYDVPTEKDRKDILWGIKNDVEIFFASFVNSAEDIIQIKRFLEDHGSDAWVFAKIESKRGVANAKEIIRVADGIVVARGDLGVEIPLERVPRVQKDLIALARRYGKPAVVATQMLTSMIDNPFPTRAEVSDIANAVYDGASALMVSNETAVGKYPVDVVKTLSRIVVANQDEVVPLDGVEWEEDADAVAYSAIKLVEQMDAKYIITPTSTGRSPRKISRFVPRANILAVSDNPRLLRKVQLMYGTETKVVEDPPAYSTFMQLVEALRKEGRVKAGEKIVGVNVARNGGTHTIRVTKA